MVFKNTYVLTISLLRWNKANYKLNIIYGPIVPDFSKYRVSQASLHRLARARAFAVRKQKV